MALHTSSEIIAFEIKLTAPGCLHKSLSFGVGSVVFGLDDEGSPHKDAHEIDQPVAHIMEESVLQTRDDGNTVKRVHFYL